MGVDADTELAELVDMLGLHGPLDELMVADAREWLTGFFQNLNSQTGKFTFPSDLSPNGKPMISLRDVESQAPVMEVIQ